MDILLPFIGSKVFYIRVKPFWDYTLIIFHS